jgi:hypothetical protein
MATLHRIEVPQPATLTVVEPVLAPRFRYADGVFAILETDPEELADLAYEAFRANHLTPGVAARQVARILHGTEPVCPPVQASPGYLFDLDREVTPLGRLRVFAHYLVQMQFAHESNQHQLRALREIHHARRLRILPGCCAVCDDVSRRSWRVSDPPILPVPGCLRHGGCKCAYVPTSES